MTWHRRAPRPLSSALGSLADDLAPATLLADIQRIWPGVVGPVIAAEARPSGERGGVLTVSCSASVWAQELDLMADAILKALNAALSGPPLRRLRCTAL